MTSQRAAEQPFNRTCTLSEAQSLASFEIVLPSYVPSGTSAEPDIFYAPDAPNTPEGARIVFSAIRSGPDDQPGLQVTILEAPGDFSLSRDYQPEVVTILGYPVQLTTDPGDEGEARIMSAWKQGNTAMGVEFLWFSDGDSHGTVTDEMRADALRVIESMISGDQ